MRRMSTSNSHGDTAVSHGNSKTQERSSLKNEWIPNDESEEIENESPEEKFPEEKSPSGRRRQVNFSSQNSYWNDKTVAEWRKKDIHFPIVNKNIKSSFSYKDMLLLGEIYDRHGNSRDHVEYFFECLDKELEKPGKDLPRIFSFDGHQNLLKIAKIMKKKK